MPPDPEMIQVGDAIWQGPQWRGLVQGARLVANVEPDDSRVAGPVPGERHTVLLELRRADGALVAGSVCPIRSGAGVEPKPVLLLGGVLPVGTRGFVVVIVEYHLQSDLLAGRSEEHTSE